MAFERKGGGGKVDNEEQPMGNIIIYNTITDTWQIMVWKLFITDNKIH